MATVSGVGSPYWRMERCRAPGSTDLREAETSTEWPVFGFPLGFDWFASGIDGDLLDEAVPVEVRERRFSCPAIRVSPATTFQSLPGMSWRLRTGPVNVSNPQYPSTTPVMALVPGTGVWGLDGGVTTGWPPAGWGVVSSAISSEGFAVRYAGEDEASLIGVGGEGNVCAGAWAFKMEDQVVGVSSGEDERRAFYREGDGGLEEAGDGGGVGGAQRRRDCGLDGREANDDDGFGIVEGGRVLRRRLRASPVGKAMAGMYWYFAVWRPLMRRTRSTMAPT